MYGRRPETTKCPSVLKKFKNLLAVWGPLYEPVGFPAIPPPPMGDWGAGIPDAKRCIKGARKPVSVDVGVISCYVIRARET